MSSYKWDGLKKKAFVIFFIFAYFYAAQIFFVSFAVPRLWPDLVGEFDFLNLSSDWLPYVQMANKLTDELSLANAPLFLHYLFEYRFVFVLAVAFKVQGTNPWALFPLFSALNTITVFGLAGILRNLGFRRAEIIFGLLPFLLFPSQFFLTLHPLKDIFFSTGFVGTSWLMIEYLLGGRASGDSLSDSVRFFFKVSFFSSLIYLSRPYFSELLSLQIVFLCTISVLLRWRSSRVFWTWRIPVRNLLLCTAAIFAILAPSSLESWFKRAQMLSLHTGLNAPAADHAKSEPSRNPSPVTANIESGTIGGNLGSDHEWRYTSFLPATLDDRLRLLSLIRQGYLNTAPEAATALDIHRNFHSAADLILMVPRILQIALFSPFPSTWSGEGSVGPAIWMRRVAGVETFLSYLGFVGLILIFLFRRSVRARFAIVVMYLLFFLFFFASFINNVGTLYRIRYCIFLVLVSLGWAGLASICMRSRKAGLDSRAG